MAGRKSYTYSELDKLQKHYGYGSTYDITGADYESDYAKQIITDRQAAAAAKRETEYETEWVPRVEEHQAALSRNLSDERALAKRQAAGKLGFALSSGPGTSGLAVAAGNALDRSFAIQGVRDRNAATQFGTQFKLNWNMQQDQWDENRAMSNLQFRQQQALLQQQAELNSKSWWEQLGSIIGFGTSQAVQYYGSPGGSGGTTNA